MEKMEMIGSKVFRLGEKKIAELREVIRFLGMEDVPPSDDCKCQSCKMKNTLMGLAVSGENVIADIFTVFREKEQEWKADGPEVWRKRVTEHFEKVLEPMLIENMRKMFKEMGVNIPDDVIISSAKQITTEQLLEMGLPDGVRTNMRPAKA